MVSLIIIMDKLNRQFLYTNLKRKEEDILENNNAREDNLQNNNVRVSSTIKVGTEDRQIEFWFWENSKIQYLHTCLRRRHQNVESPSLFFTLL